MLTTELKVDLGSLMAKWIRAAVILTKHALLVVDAPCLTRMDPAGVEATIWSGRQSRQIAGFFSVFRSGSTQRWGLLPIQPGRHNKDQSRLPTWNIIVLNPISRRLFESSNYVQGAQLCPVCPDSGLPRVNCSFQQSIGLVTIANASQQAVCGFFIGSFDRNQVVQKLQGIHNGSNSTSSRATMPVSKQL
jgi:hypothetical protein